MPENVNYAVKSSLLLSFFGSVPGVEAKLEAQNMAEEKFEDVVKSPKTPQCPCWFIDLASALCTDSFEPQAREKTLAPPNQITC